jgi:hypothetical protein
MTDEELRQRGIKMQLPSGRGFSMPTGQRPAPTVPVFWCTYCTEPATISTWTRDDLRSTRSRHGPVVQLVCADCFAGLTG